MALTVPVTTPCDVQGGGGSTTERSASNEGLSIGDPIMGEYFKRLGYRVEPATPSSVFSSVDAAKRELGELWKAAG